MPSSFCDSPFWRIVFRDEFDLPTIDKRWWTILNGTHKKPHDQLKADCHGSDCDLLGACRDAACTVDSVKVAGGRLVLTSQRRRAFGRNFTTGAVITRDKLTFLSDDEPFRMCIAAVLPGVPGRSAGVWPAHWLMPDNDGSCDPDHGEMDIMEMVKGDGNAYSTYHWQDKAPKCASSQPFARILRKEAGGRMEHNAARVCRRARCKPCRVRARRQRRPQHEQGRLHAVHPVVSHPQHGPRRRMARPGDAGDGLSDHARD